MIFTFKHYSGAYLSKWSKHRRNNSTIITRRVSDFFVFDGIVQFTLVWMFFRFFFKIANDFRSSTELWCFRADLVRNLQNNTFLPVPQRDQLTWDAYQRHMTFVFEIFFFYCSDPVKLLLRRLNTSGAFSVITYVRQHISNQQLHFSLSKIIKGGKKASTRSVYVESSFSVATNILTSSLKTFNAFTFI